MKTCIFFSLLFCLTLSLEIKERVRGHEHPVFVNLAKLRVALDTAISLNASPSLLEKSGSWVTVSWSGVTDPSNGDWIGVYSPSRVSFTETSPIKYQFASKSADYRSGTGELKFMIINMRADVIFTYCRGDLENPTIVALSNIVRFQNPNEPLQPHLALTGSISEMRLTWNSLNASQPKVLWGTRSGIYENSALASTFSYSRSQLCGAPATTTGWRDPGLLHSAILTGLKPDQIYYYKFGDIFGLSEEFHFMSSPVIKPNNQIDLVAYGDMGKGEIDQSLEHWEEVPSLQTTRGIVSDLQGKNPPRFALHIGDLSYAVGYSSQWDEFFAQIAPIASAVPYHVCLGNHERDYPHSGSFYNGTDSGGECGIPAEVRFPMPNKPSIDRFWYSFDYGNIHFVLMNTEQDFRNGSEQWNFLDQDLSKVDRTKTPWLIFAGHRPMYIDSTDDDPDGGDLPVAAFLRKHVEPLLYKHKVDLALWGHHHSYQRTCPVYQEICDNKNPTVHVVIGMAGQGLSTNIKSIPPSWIVYVNDLEYGYSRIRTTATNLFMEFIGNNGYAVRDSFTLSK